VSVGSVEAVLLLYLIVAAALHAALAIGLFLWGRWVARRRGGRSWRARWLPIVALALSVLGAALGAVLVVRAFGAVAGADPSEKATLLAASISEAMNCAAACAVPAWLLYLASLVLFTAGSLLRRKAS
jgi:hypothetical protein